MTDAVGNEIKVGDRVAYIIPYYLYLKIGVITKLTPKGATIDKRLNRGMAQMVKEVKQ